MVPRHGHPALAIATLIDNHDFVSVVNAGTWRDLAIGTTQHAVRGLNGMTIDVDTLNQVRYDNVGSMIRPQALRQAFDDAASGQIDDAELVAAQEAAVRDLVAEQERRGYPIVVDGEYRRRMFTESFAEIEGLAGWEARYTAAADEIAERDYGTAGKWRAASHEVRVPVTAPLRLLRNVALEQFERTQALTDTPVKPTLVGPERIFQTLDYEASRAVYPDRWDLLDAVVAAQREIIAGLVDAGCRYVHIDAPGFTAYVDPPSLERLRSRGFEPAELMRRAIEAENAIIRGFPGVTFGIHLCRGNQNGHWHREGPYDAIAEELFGSLAHQRLLLEYDTERAGTFAPLRFVPDGKVAVLGLVTTKSARVETADELRQRIDEAATYLDVDRLAISPQCGFESNVGGAVMRADAQWRKLDVLLEVGREIWG